MVAGSARALPLQPEGLTTHAAAPSPPGACPAGKPGHVNYDTVPSIVYTHPEVASVGITEDQAKERKLDVKVGRASGRRGGGGGAGVVGRQGAGGRGMGRGAGHSGCCRPSRVLLARGRAADGRVLRAMPPRH
jgi:hypothetical protein